MALVLLAGIPARNRFLGLLNNAGHAPIFGALAWINLRLIESRSPALRPAATSYLAAFGATLTVGAAVEGVQSLIGRDAQWVDVAMDAAGAGAALSAVLAVRAGRHRPLLAGAFASLAVFLLAAVAAPVLEAWRGYRHRADAFPVLVTAERPSDLYFLSGSGSVVRRGRLPEPWAGGVDVPAVEVGLERGRNPGLRHEEPAPDWRGYRKLYLDLVNPGDQPLRLVLRVHDFWHDQRHDDRFNRAFALHPRSRRVVAVPLEDIEQAPRGRRMDMSRIAGLVLFEASGEAPVGARFYVTRVWLD